jgi:RHS repeat-associated protein
VSLTTTASTTTTTSNTSYIYGDLLFGGTAPIEQITTSSTGVATASFLASSPSGVQVVYSSNGAVQEQALYSLYGTQHLTAGSEVTPFGFQGSYQDSTGLVYLINRYYDPTTDQFLSVDPKVSQTDQPYVFTNDSPLNATDPLGLFRAGIGGQLCGGGAHPTCNTGNTPGPTTVRQSSCGDGGCAQDAEQQWEAFWAGVKAYLSWSSQHGNDVVDFTNGLLTEGIKRASPVAGDLADGLGTVTTYLSESGSVPHKVGGVIVSAGSTAIGGLLGAAICGGTDVSGTIETGDPAACSSPSLVIGSFASGAGVAGTWIYDNVGIPGTPWP